MRSSARTIALAMLTAVVVAVPAASAATVKVTNADVGGHWSTADSRNQGVVSFATGPGSPPLGVGSVQFSTPNNPDKTQMLPDLHAGTKLSTITGIGYATYRDPSSTGFAATLPSINIAVDLDGNGTFDGTMVYEPYQDMGNAAVQTGVWQTWDAFRGGAGKWWVTRNAVPACTQSTPCPFSQIASGNPAGVIFSGYSFGANQGSFNGGVKAAVDALTISAGGSSTTYDFEPTCAGAGGAAETGPVSSIVKSVRGLFGNRLQPVNDLLRDVNCSVIVPLGL
jgi:hypothetical protein